jgi:hypothetical protein
MPPPNRALLADQVTVILDRADPRHEAARVAKRRAGLKVVCDDKNTPRTDGAGNCVRYQFIA